MSLSSKLSKRTFPTQDVTICLDAALGTERDALIAKARRSPADAKALKKLEDEMRDSLVTIRVTGVPYVEFLKIQRSHPGRKGVDFTGFNTETFWGDFIYKTASVVEDDGSLSRLSEMPRKEWDEFSEGLTAADLDALAIAVDATNNKRVATDFLSRGSASTEPSSPTFEPLEPGE